jgi:hypothetical protein
MGLLNKFKKSDFRLIGNRGCLRTDEEMRSINKNIADNAFKRYKKEIMDSYMKTQGFFKYKNDYVRKNKIDLLEYIYFQKDHYGSKTFTVTICILPLYILRECIAFDFAYRLGELICNKDIWWDFANDDICEKSMCNVREAIELFALPWFKKMEDEEYVKELLEEQKTNRDQKWLNAIENQNKSETIIRENINKFKLPKKLI